MSQKEIKTFGGLSNSKFAAVLKTISIETLTYQSKGNFDVKALFDKVTNQSEPKIRKMLISGLHRKEYSKFGCGP